MLNNNKINKNQDKDIDKIIGVEDLNDCAAATASGGFMRGLPAFPNVLGQSNYLGSTNNYLRSITTSQFPSVDYSGRTAEEAALGNYLNSIFKAPDALSEKFKAVLSAQQQQLAEQAGLANRFDFQKSFFGASYQPGFKY